MAADEPTNFFIAILLKDGENVGHAVAFDPTHLDEKKITPSEESEDKSQSASLDANTFLSVFNSFVSIVTTYQNFLQFTMSLAPMISNAIAERTIGEFARNKGSKRSDLSTETRTVYELPIDTFRQLKVHQDEITAAFGGAALLPEVLLIGLVSAYDSFLAKLLRVIFLLHNEIILTSEKTIKFSELSTFKSIEEARDSLIDREIESVLRDSHQDHFKWMESKFKVSLKTDLAVFPTFVEICERRNLLTHTGGIISTKYIDNCAEQKVSMTDLKVGDKLTVDNKYYSIAVNAVSEIGIKLCYVLWRKFAEEERTQADRALNELSYDLIVRRNYSLAEAILSFSTKILKKRGSDACRRMMVINHANAVRLQKRQAEAVKLLESEDWSAVSNEYAISVAAVREDKQAVADLIKRIGPHNRPNAEDYRTWPVFRGLRADPLFKEAFQSTFGEPVVNELVDIANPQLTLHGQTKH